MADIAATHKKLDQLATSLENQKDYISASRLRQLMVAIGGDPSAQDWASTNIQNIIDPQAIADGIKNRTATKHWISIVEWIRNALVLFPLILTWLGISLASQKYQELINSDSKQEIHSFLYLWQQGFNHTLPGPFVLNNLAFADCLLLLIIFIFTLVATSQHHLIHSEAEKRAEQMRTNLSHALGDAALCLSQVRRQQQQNQPTSVQDVAQYLFQFSQQFKTTIDQFINELTEERKRRGDLQKFTDALDRMSSDMLAAANSMSKTNADLTQTLQSILAPVQEIPRIVSAAGQAVGELNRIASNLSTIVADQKQANQQMQNLLAQQTAEQKQAAQDLHTMINNSFHLLLVEQKNLGQALITAAQELDNSTQDLGNFVQGLGKTAADQTQVLALMQTLVGEQAKLTGEMRAATVDLKNVFKPMHDAVPELRSMAIDMNKFVLALRDIPIALNSDLLTPIQHYSGAAAKINVGSDTLNNAAQHLDFVIQKLDRRLGP
jgi:hypothetical protein